MEDPPQFAVGSFNGNAESTHRKSTHHLVWPNRRKMSTAPAHQMEPEMMTRKAVMTFLDEELLPASGVRKKPALDENLLDSGILDSLGIMKLLEYLERTFSISVDEEDLLPENFESINAIILLLQKYQQRQVRHG